MRRSGEHLYSLSHPADFKNTFHHFLGSITVLIERYKLPPFCVCVPQEGSANKQSWWCCWPVDPAVLSPHLFFLLNSSLISVIVAHRAPLCTSLRKKKQMKLSMCWKPVMSLLKLRRKGQPELNSETLVLQINTHLDYYSLSLILNTYDFLNDV